MYDDDNNMGDGWLIERLMNLCAVCSCPCADDPLSKNPPHTYGEQQIASNYSLARTPVSEMFVRRIQRRDYCDPHVAKLNVDILGDEHRAPPWVLRGARFGFERGPSEHAAAHGSCHTALLLAIAKLVREGDADFY